MKFKVYNYDIKSTYKAGKVSSVGRYELYNEAGEFIEGSGKRRVRNYDPYAHELAALPIQAIKKLTDNKDVCVSRLADVYNPITNRADTVFEVVCE